MDSDGTTLWEKIATTRWGSYLTESERRVILQAQALRDGSGRALEVGCEGGRWSRMLADLGWKMTCIDVATEVLDECRRKNPEAECLLARPEDQTIPSPSGTFDLVLCIEVAPVIQSEWFLDEAARVLRDTGLLVSVVWNRRSLRGLAHRLARQSEEANNGEVYYEESYRSWRGRLVRSGFELVHEEGFCWGPFGRSSDSPAIPLFVKLERLLGLHRLPGFSPWVMVIACKRPHAADGPVASPIYRMHDIPPMAPFDAKTSPSRTAPVPGSVPMRQAADGPRSRRLPIMLGFAVLLLASFWGPLSRMVTAVLRSEFDSYVLLVPFISAYLIYIRRNQLTKAYGSSLGFTGAFMVAGAGVALAAWDLHSGRQMLSEHDFLSAIVLSFVLLLIAGGFLFLGRRWMAAVAFPAAFLLLMVPIPDQVVELLETASKLASADAADLFFRISGIPVLRDGVIFQLPGITVQVARECSGIRSSLVLFITAVLASNLFLRSSWRRLVLIAFVIPLGIVRNGFRILVIGYLCVAFGPQMIDSIIHRRGGPLFFAISLIPLGLLLWWLRRGETGKRSGSRGAGGGPKLSPSQNAPEPAKA